MRGAFSLAPFRARPRDGRNLDDGMLPIQIAESLFNSAANGDAAKLRSFPRKRESRAKSWIPVFAGQAEALFDIALSTPRQRHAVCAIDARSGCRFDPDVAPQRHEGTHENPCAEGFLVGRDV